MHEAVLSFGRTSASFRRWWSAASTRWSSSCRYRCARPRLRRSHGRYDVGNLSSPRGILEYEQVERLCSLISSRGHGLVGPSTYLSPYQVLLLGQSDTLDLLEAEMRQHLPKAISLRRRPNNWPPLHTRLVWERSVPNRAAVALYHTGGGHTKPKPTVVSCTTGKANYDEWNSREILTEWTDHPQRLWEVMEHTLASGADLVVQSAPSRS